MFEQILDTFKNAVMYIYELILGLFQSFVVVLILAPFAIFLLIIPGMQIYYWLLKPISLRRALGYNLITLTISFVISILVIKLMPTHILDFFPGALKAIPGLSCAAIVNLLFMHFVFKHPYKKLALPVLLNIIIIFASIILLDAMPVGLGM